jgi:hypothetical protein
MAAEVADDCWGRCWSEAERPTLLTGPVMMDEAGTGQRVPLTPAAAAAGDQHGCSAEGGVGGENAA